MVETVNNTNNSSPNKTPAIEPTHTSHAPSTEKESTVNSLTAQYNSLKQEAAKLRSEASCLWSDASAKEKKAGELRGSGDNTLSAQEKSNNKSPKIVSGASELLAQAHDAIQENRTLCNEAIETAAEAESKDIYAGATKKDIIALTGKNDSSSLPEEVRPGGNNTDRGRSTNINPSPNGIT